MSIEEYRYWCVTHAERRDLLDSIPALYKSIVGNRHIEYISVSFGDSHELFDKVFEVRGRFDKEYGCKLFEQNHEGVHGSWCDWVVIMIEDPALDDEMEILFDLIHNFGVR